jgi:hypothetical protein
MRSAGQKLLWGWVTVGGLVVLQFWPGLALAQQTNAPKPRPGLESPPLPQPAKSPVDFFRELLAMSFAERSQALADRAPESRKQILAKIREYEAMKPSARELRLRATELRWYLLPLMRIEATNRTVQLGLIPPDIRPLVDTRLKEWDLLPSEVQKDFLKREAAIRIFTLVQAGGNTNQVIGGENISSNRQSKIEKEVRELREMSSEKRDLLLSRYDRYMGLSEEEKNKTLETISGPERVQIEKTLQKFENLTPEQRAACLRSFVQLKKLKPDERQEFLRNAAKWSKMSPDERKQWQELVDRVQLLPPSMQPVAPLPPKPRMPGPKGAPAAGGTTVATNGGGKG